MYTLTLCRNARLAAQLAPPTPAPGAAPPAAVMGAPQLPAGNTASPLAAGLPEVPGVVPAAPGGTTLSLPALSDTGDDSGAVAGPSTPLQQPDAPAHAEVFAAVYRGTEEDGGTASDGFGARGKGDLRSSARVAPWLLKNSQIK